MPNKSIFRRLFILACCVATLSGARGYAARAGSRLGLAPNALFSLTAFMANSEAQSSAASPSIRLAMAPAPRRIVPRSAKQWNNIGGGVWSDPSNWTPTGVPGPGDDVTIPHFVSFNYTVTLDINASINSITIGDASGPETQTLVINNHSLTLANQSTADQSSILGLGPGGTIDGAGELDIVGVFDWTGGTMTGTGLTLIEGHATPTFSGALLLGRTVSYLSFGNFTVPAGAVSTTLSATSGGSGAVFNNAGTLDCSGAITFNSITFNNNTGGFVEVLTGTLQLANCGGTSVTAFAVDAGAVLNFNGGTYNFNGGVFIGPGNSAAATIGGTVQFSAGVFNCNAATAIGGSTNINSALTFVLAGGRIGGSGAINVAASSIFRWTGGTLGATGATNIATNIALGASLVVSNGASHFLGRTINATGPINMADSSIISDPSGNGIINNNGVLTSNQTGAGGPNLFNDIALNNNRTVTVNSGTLNIGVTSNSNTGTSHGTFTVASGAALQFIGGTHTLTAGATFTGAGATRITVGTVLANGAVAVGTAGGVASTLDLAGGVLGGTGTVTVNPGSTMSWSSGNMVATGTTVIATGGVLNVTGAGGLSRTITNNGIMSINANLQGSGGTGVIDNAGVINATPPAGATSHIADIAFDNNSQVNVTGGTLQIVAASAAVNTGTSTGTFDVSSGAALEFANGTQTLNSATFIGTGISRLTGGVLTVNGTTNIGNAPTTGRFDLDAGTLNGSGTLAVTGTGTLNWVLGDMAGTGTTHILSGGQLNMAGAGGRSLGRTITNDGIIAMSGGASIGKDVGTTPAINDHATFTSAGAGTTDSISDIAFNNTGQATVQSGALQIVAGSAAVNTGTSTGTFTTASGAILDFANGTQTLNSASFLGVGLSQQTGGFLNIGGTVNIGTNSSAGNFRLAAGTMQGTGNLHVGAAGILNWTGGTMAQANGATIVSGGGQFNIAGSGGQTLSTSINNQGTATISGGITVQSTGAPTFTNNGTFTSSPGATANAFNNVDFVNNGTLNVGGPSSTGIFNVSGGSPANGNFTQSSTGILNIDIGGTTPGTGFDQLNVNGAATLAGTLNIALVGGFTPAVGNSFPVVTYGSHTGAFTIGTNAALFNASYTPTVLNLVAKSTGPTTIVTTTADNGNNTSPTAGSLRAAINFANAHPGTTINFNIPGAGVQSIAVPATLPTLTTNGTVIDGYSQPGATPNTLAIGDNAVLKIELRGNSTIQGGGLPVTAANCTIEGLTINGFSFQSGGAGHGSIEFTGTAATGDVVRGCFIGTDTAGATAVSNFVGVAVYAGATHDTIGGPTPAARNVISASAAYGVGIGVGGGETGGITNTNTVQGNYIGTNAAGTAALPNSSYAGLILFGGTKNNVIGGTSAGAGNVISGNSVPGIDITDLANTNTVQGNTIGTNAAGTAALPNTSDGILISGGSGNTIGGAGAGRNVISGNSGRGIQLVGSASNIIQGNYLGTNAAGTSAVGNAHEGLYINKAATNTIGGLTAGAGNLIAGNGFLSGGNAGLAIIGSSATGNVVQGNLIGTNATGTGKIGNAREGVFIDGANNTVGGMTAQARNVISGNGREGVRISSLFSIAATGNVVQGNFIGTNAAGTGALGNTLDGVLVDSVTGAVQNNVVGARRTDTGAAVGQSGNTIAFNGGNGVAVSGATATSNTIRGNLIHDNTRLGIDLVATGDPANGVTPNDPPASLDADTGPNNLQNFPVITSVDVSGGATNVTGVLDSQANKSYIIDLYRNVAADASGYGEGQIYVTSATVTTNAQGHANFTFAPAGSLTGQFFSATATDATSGDTSEFGHAVQAIVATAGITLSATTTTVSEGGPAMTGTVTRNVVASTPLTVTIASSAASTVLLAATPGAAPATSITVTIPANAASVNFSIVPVNDQILNPGGQRTATLTATAGALVSNPLTITLTDNESISTGLFGWGYNDFGQVGDGTTATPPLPVLVNLSNVATIAANGSHTLAVLTNGTMQSWGYNAAGQLGDGTTTDRHTPVAVQGGLNNVRTTPGAVAAGWYHSLAVKNDGTVWAWGYNASGQLGNGTTTGSKLPVQVRGPNGAGFLTNVVAVTAGVYHSMALKSDGTVWAWGYNYYGQLGNATQQDSAYPVQVHDTSGSGVLNNVTAISAGAGHSIAVTSGGNVLAWGWNFYGQLGNNQNGDSTLPMPVPGLSGVSQVAAGYAHNLVATTSGSVFSWGSNFYSQLGDGTATDRHSPVQVHGAGNTGFLGNVKSLAAGAGHSMALRNDGTVVAWGFDFYGSLGDGQSGNGANKAYPVPVQRLTNATQIAAAYGHSMALGTGLVVR